MNAKQLEKKKNWKRCFPAFWAKNTNKKRTAPFRGNSSFLYFTAVYLSSFT